MLKTIRIISMGIINWSNDRFTNATRATLTTADDLHTGTFILACGFDSYSGKSGTLLSGVNTLGSDLYLNATFASSGSAVIDTGICAVSEFY